MKKIANKILLLALSSMLCIIIAFSFVSFKFADRIITDLTNKNLYDGTNQWKIQFEEYFREKSAAIDIARDYTEKLLSLEKLKDPDSLSAEFDNMEKLFSSIVLSREYFNFYAWFHPDYTSSELMEISVRDLEGDGNLKIVTNHIYTAADIVSTDWQWFTKAMEYGEAITGPYMWEEYDYALISSTKKIVVEGQDVGVIGSDLYIHDLEKMLLSKPFMQNGQYALLSADLFFLVHSEHKGFLWDEIYTDNIIQTTRSLLDKAVEFGVLESDGKKIGFSRLSNGWIVLAIPDMDEIDKEMKFLLQVYIFMFLIFLMVIIFLSLIISRSISMPILAAGNFSVNILNSNMEIEMPSGIINSKDEVGRLCRNMEEMRIKLKERIEALQKQSERSDFLFQELYHRTKNNLQLIGSFISLELDEYHENGECRSLRKIENRIHVLSMIQDMIYADETIDKMQFSDFIIEIVSLMDRVYELHEKGIELDFLSVSGMLLKQNMVPMGFLINEIFASIFINDRYKQNCEKIIINTYIENCRTIFIFNAEGVERTGKFSIEPLNLEMIRAISEVQLNGKMTAADEGALCYRFEFRDI